MINKLLEKYNTEYNSIPFSEFKLEDYMPAIKYSVEDAYKNIEKIKENGDKPTFSNVIEALDNAEYLLEKVTNVYFNLYSLDSDSDFKELSEEISPLLAKLSGDIFTDSKLFEKVQAVYKNIDSLESPEEKRLCEKTYKAFVRNGALLSEEKKQALKDIDNKLSTLSPKFSKNTLDATNDFYIHITDEKRVEGIPSNALDAAKHVAKQKGFDSGWVFTLQMPSYFPVISYAKDRELRKEMNLAYGTKNLEGKFDNRDIIKETVELRDSRAKLLGYKNHADYTLENRMANKVEIVENFLQEIYEVAYPAAKKELDIIKDYAKKIDEIEDLQSWDFSYYSQLYKKEKYSFDEEELRPYFKSENVIEGVFTVANKMYDLNFTEIDCVDKYHEEVKTFKVTGTDDEYIGLLYVDLFPRATKRGGAWMNTFKVQGLQEGNIERPHVLISGNLTPSTPENPALLSFDEVRTIFHEFGHALHGLLSDVKYTSLASPNVLWDFVELPSQIMENWLLEEETLSIFAKHYKTGEIIPKELIEKIIETKNFNAGNFNLRQLSLGLLDMAWHTADPKEIEDVKEFEDRINDKCRLLPKTPSNTSTGFSHIFAGGYSAGYYSYKWAEVLDADAFNLFKEKGIFNKDVAKSFRENILSKGNTVEPMKLYESFRGKKPDPKALLVRDGLL